MIRLLTFFYNYVIILIMGGVPMKKFLCLLLAASFILASCSINNQKNILPDIKEKITEKITENTNDGTV